MCILYVPALEASSWPIVLSDFTVGCHICYVELKACRNAFFCALSSDLSSVWDDRKHEVVLSKILTWSVSTNAFIMSKEQTNVVTHAVQGVCQNHSTLLTAELAHMLCALVTAFERTVIRPCRCRWLKHAFILFFDYRVCFLYKKKLK